MTLTAPPRPGDKAAPSWRRDSSDWAGPPPWPERLKRLAHRLARYATVSVISTSVTLSLLGLLVYTGALTPGWANVVATAVGTVPSFELNRRWVWAKRGRRSLGREVVPFCTLSFAGLALSTVAVSVAAHWARGDGLSTASTAVVSQLANLSTFGALWVAQFFMLDRLLFRSPSAPSGTDVGSKLNEATKRP